MSPQKRQNDLILFLRQTLNITKIQVDTPNTDAKEAEVDQFYENCDLYFNRGTPCSGYAKEQVIAILSEVAKDRYV